MSVSLNSIPYFNGYNYGYRKSHMRFFLKAIDVWHIVESGRITLDTTIAEWTAIQEQNRATNDKAMNAISATLSPSNSQEFLIVKLLRKHGISLKLHMKEPNLLNLLDFKC
jgi:hypothetical protein